LRRRRKMRKAVFLVLFLFPLVIPQNYRKVRVGIQKGLCAHGNELDDLVNNINADSRFTASVVDDSQIDSVDELNANFDTIYIGGSGNQGVDNNQLSAAAATAVTKWVQQGGGLVSSTFIVTALSDGTLSSSLQPVIPVKLDGSATDAFCTRQNNYGISFTDFTHPVAQDVPSSYFYVNAHCAFSRLGLSPGATSIASIVDSPSCTELNSVTAPEAVVVMSPGSGRSVYLCMPFCGLDIYFGSRNLWINSNTAAVFKSALWWTANIGPCPPDCLSSAPESIPTVLLVVIALIVLLAH